MNLGLDPTQLNVVVMVFLANLVLGVLVAIKLHQFEWAKVADVLKDRFLLLGGGYAVANVLLGQFSLIDPTVPKTAVFMALSAAMGAHLYNQVRELGVPYLPDLPWVKKSAPPIA